MKISTVIARQDLTLKPIRSRVDYNFFNYCSTCGL